MDCEPFLTALVKADIIAHMERDRPNEACGIVITTDDGYAYEPLVNKSKTPDDHYELSKKDSKRVMTDPKVVALSHSHPKGNFSPSKHDLKMQIAVDKPFIISVRNPATGVAGVYSFGDHMLDYPLYQRPWLYGVFDCLEGIRGWHHQSTGIYIPRAPRTDFWWVPDRQDEVAEEDKDIYAKSIVPYGFVEYDPNFADPNHLMHPKIGDVMFMQYNSPFINHAGVYIGNNLIFHHRDGKASGKHPLGYFLDQHVIRKWTRHKSFMV